MLFTRNPLKVYRHKQVKKRWKKIYYANTNQKKAGEATLISDRAVFRPKTNYQG